MNPIVVFLQNLNDEARRRLRPLYERAETEAGLTATDYYTIKDLLELSGLDGKENLHVLLLVMFATLNEGSPCIELSESALTEQLADLAGDDAASWAIKIVTDLQADQFAALIGPDIHANKPLVLFQAGKSPFLYFQKFLKQELAAWEILQERVMVDSGVGSPEQTRAVLANVLNALPEKTQLNADQQLALGLALLRPVAIISGGPGTGKTSVVASLIRCMVRLGISPERIALAAPTGRAAQRLTDTIHGNLGRLTRPLDAPDYLLKESNPKATTLHQLLRYSPTSGTFRHHEENPVPFDVVIVDEVSMVGLTLVAQLLRTLPPTARLVLLGDKDQLPSIEAGSWLTHLASANGEPTYSDEFLSRLKSILPQRAAGLIPAGTNPEVRKSAQPFRDLLAVLQENYRSEKRIQLLAAAINRQDVSVLDQVPRPTQASKCPGDGRLSFSLADELQEGGCWLLEPEENDPAWWRRVQRWWAEHHYLSGAASFRDRAMACVLDDSVELDDRREELRSLFEVVDGARILTLIREGKWGAAGINQYLAQLVRPVGERGMLFPGAPVLITRNDHARHLFNGDVGLALPSRDGGLVVVFPKQGGFVSFAAATLPAHEYAFALTIHKSQGSEYDQVMLVVPPEGGRRLLTKELIYTGLTRAKHVALLCGPATVFAAAVSRRIRRASGVMQ